MGKAWAVMWAAFLASVAVVINQFKVPPVMHILLEELSIDLALGGWLMSIFSVAGIILSLPAALTLDRFGARLSGMVALICTVLGSLIGTFATNATMLLAGRAVEGIGLGLIAVVAPAVIAMWFPPEKRGLPMGIWAAWVPVGSFIILNLASPINGSFGWQGVWWFGSGFALIALILYSLIVSEPPLAGEEKSGTERISGDLYRKGLKSPAIWLLAVGFGGFGFANAAFVTWGPSFLMERHGFAEELANFYVSLSPMVAIGATVIAGWVIDKSGKPKTILLVSSIMACLLYGYAFLLNSVALVVPWMIMLGLFPGFFPTSSFTLAPEAVPTPMLAGLAMALINLMFNLGFMMGPPLVGALVNQAQGNWSAGALPVVAALLITITTSGLFAKKT
ncbi:MAG: MFS transporter [Clostridia bacterium]|nr:MFS transporter [Clostridia bacterium]